MGAVVELKKSVPVVADVDVLIVGAGIAGAIAAVAAGRNGTKTMVVDQYGYPGGNMGPGMIGGDPNLTREESMLEEGMPGILGEFEKRCDEYCNAPLFAHYFRDSQVISYVWTQMMQEAGVQFMYNTYAGDPIMEGNRVTGLLVENKNGTQAIRAKVVVDATGDADVAARAGAPMDGGKGLFHPGIYWAMANVDVEKYWSEVWSEWTPPDPNEARYKKPQNFLGQRPPFTPRPEDVKWGESVDKSIDKPHPSVAGIAKSWNKGPLIPYYRPAWESGEYKFMQEIDGLGYVQADHGLFRGVAGVQYAPDPLRMGKYGIIGALVGIWRNENPTSGDTKIMTALEVKARTFIFETAQFLTRRMPGFEKAYLHIIAPYFNSRGGRSVVSEHPITREDIAQGRRFDDAVFQLVAPPDDGSIAGTPYDFPYRQFLPKGVDGLLVTGRACAIQPPVTRVRWMVLLMGQAAGAAAALIAKSGTTTRELDIKELQSLLHHKYQGPFGDEKRLRELGLV